MNGCSSRATGQAAVRAAPVSFVRSIGPRSRTLRKRPVARPGLDPLRTRAHSFLHGMTVTGDDATPIAAKLLDPLGEYARAEHAQVEVDDRGRATTRRERAAPVLVGRTRGFRWAGRHLSVAALTGSKLT
jgi:hypothetical protein